VGEAEERQETGLAKITPWLSDKFNPHSTPLLRQMDAPAHFIGIDVQAARGCPYVILDDSAETLDSGWLQGESQDALSEYLCTLVDQQKVNTSVGIDAPRLPLSSPRQWYWEGATGRWRRCRAADLGRGRHCEIVIAAHRLANPQWTPHQPPFPRWMELGFRLFSCLSGRVRVYEVFPSASYTLLSDDSDDDTKHDRGM